MLYVYTVYGVYAGYSVYQYLLSSYIYRDHAACSKVRRKRRASGLGKKGMNGMNGMNNRNDRKGTIGGVPIVACRPPQARQANRQRGARN